MTLISDTLLPFLATVKL